MMSQKFKNVYFAYSVVNIHNIFWLSYAYYYAYFILNIFLTRVF